MSCTKNKKQQQVSCPELDQLDFSNQITVYPDAESELMTFCGFEIPRYTRSLVKRILRRLHREKIIRFTHDDGVGAIVHQELKVIANSIGIKFTETIHEIVLYMEDEIVEYAY